MLPASWSLLLILLWIAPLLVCCRASPSTVPAECSAAVEYVAVTGDPATANKSELFRGFIRVDDQRSGGDSYLSWTFTNGESIHGEDNVFLEIDNERVEFGEIAFSSSMATTTEQSVELKYSSESEEVHIGFVGNKGSIRIDRKELEDTGTVGLPLSLEYNEMSCKLANEDSDQQFEASQDDADLQIDDSIVKLEYMPIEIKGFEIGSGFGSKLAVIAFRLRNTGRTPIDLVDVELEYWFNGESAQSKSSDTAFKSHCLKTTLANDCSEVDISVQPGLEKVAGAHYKVVIGFEKGAGSLDPERQISLPIGGSLPEGGPTSVEVLFNVTSDHFFTQTDVTKDYSFKNTKIIANVNDSSLGYVRREYEVNPRMPVFINGELIFGCRPKRSLRKSETPIYSTQNHCWSTKKGYQQCGVRAKYCCARGGVTRGGMSLKWLQIVGWILAGAFLSIIFCNFCFWRRRHARMKRNSGCMLSGHDYVFYEEIDESFEVSSSQKYYSAPSLDMVHALLLDPNVKDWNPREEKTWSGHVHWYWEPWNEAEVRRASTALLEQNSNSGPLFTMTNRSLKNIDVHVDYKKDIEPHIKHQLGEGGFGKVYQASFRGLDVAVKVLKVDTDEMIKNLEDEILLSSKFHNEHIVKLLGACLGDKDNVCLIMELVDGGNLSTRIHNKNLRRLEYIEVLNIGLDIARGLAYLHPTVVHRDLKPQNVLLSKDGRCKIADFGISKLKEPHKSHLSVTQTGGTPNYMAPELFNGTRVDEKCDVFSLGCILYEAMTSRVPLSDLKKDHGPPLFQIIKTVAIDKQRPKIPPSFPYGLAVLIRSCWKDNPMSRPTSNELAKQLAHLIDVEVERVKELRESAQRKDSSASSSTDRKSSVLSAFGRRSLDPFIEASKWLKPKPRVADQPTPEHQMAPHGKLSLELPTLKASRSLDFVSAKNKRESEALRKPYQMESTVSDPVLKSNELQEPQQASTGYSAHAFPAKTAAHGDSHEVRTRKKSRHSKEYGHLVTPLMAVEEEFEPASKPVRLDAVSLDLDGVIPPYGNYTQEAPKSEPFPGKVSSSRYSDVDQHEIDDSFLVELAGIQSKVRTQS